MLPIGLGSARFELSDGDAMLGSDSRVASGCGQQRSYISVQSSDKFSGCCTEHRKKMSYGFFLTALITMSWAGGTHFLKAIEDEYQHALVANAHAAYLVFNSSSQHTNGPTSIKQPPSVRVPLYHAPFFTTWFCTTFNALFYPVYITSRLCVPASEKPSLKKELVHTVQPYQEKGVSVGHFLCHCGTFTVLWVLSHYLFIRSLALLDATDVIALYATSVVFFYLLSWVLLQEQFVGIRIVAVIICNTGIALFAYMDGQSRSATLGGVVMAATASAGTAVQKVVFKKFIGEVNFAQMSLFISFVGIFDLILMWPLFLILYFTGLEVIEWENLPWLPLICASVFIFFANLLGNFGLMWTYETFLTLGLCIAIPVSAVVDSYLYSVTFRGMKLAGMILTIWGFLTVLLPNNWPDYLTVLLRSGRRKFTSERPNSSRSSTASRLRTHSGRVR